MFQDSKGTLNDWASPPRGTAACVLTDNLISRPSISKPCRTRSVCSAVLQRQTRGGNAQYPHTRKKKTRTLLKDHWTARNLSIIFQSNFKNKSHLTSLFIPCHDSHFQLNRETLNWPDCRQVILQGTSKAGVSRQLFWLRKIGVGTKNRRIKSFLRDKLKLLNSRRGKKIIIAAQARQNPRCPQREALAWQHVNITLSASLRT